MSSREEVLAALADFHAAQSSNDLDGIVAAFAERGTAHGAPRTREQVRAFFKRLVDSNVLASTRVNMQRCEVVAEGGVATAEPVVYDSIAGRLVKSYQLTKEADGAWRILHDRDTALPEDLPTFDDRWTMRYVRVFEAPVERVWKAVTTTEDLNVWLVPVSRVEAKLGGRVTFTWGRPEEGTERSPAGAGVAGEVTVFEPPRVIRFQWRRPDGELEAGYLQFEVEPVADGTRFTFIQRFAPDFRQDQTGFDPDAKDAALPAGPDSPWRPGFVAGFHLNLDNLGTLVRVDPPDAWIRRESARRVDAANDPGQGLKPGARGSWSDLVEFYFDYIRKTCPPRR